MEQWAEIRRLYFVKRLLIKEIVRRTGHGAATRSGGRYARLSRPGIGGRQGRRSWSCWRSGLRGG